MTTRILNLWPRARDVEESPHPQGPNYNRPSAPGGRLSRPSRFYPAAKRLLDVIAAGFGLLLLLPLGLLIGLAVKVSDGGPVFYGQTRIGRAGKPFRIWKFRSMVIGAEKRGIMVTRDGDPRITRVGRWLRKTKLDELPQLWNVLVGDMSLVGPRPEVARYVERYTPRQREVLRHKPGITDLASLLFVNEEHLLRGSGDVEAFYLRYCLPKKIELNLHYAESATLVKDIWIILRTICPYWLMVLGVHCVLLALSFWLCYLLRADFRPTHADYLEFRRLLPWVLVPQAALLIWRGQMRGLLSYFSAAEMWRVVGLLALAFGLQAALGFATAGRLAPGLSVALLDFIICCFTVCGVRMALRRVREVLATRMPNCALPPRRVAIVGTGVSATRLALDFGSGCDPARQVVAFFDDDPRAWRGRPYDIPVEGMPECLLSASWADRIDEVVIALPTEDSARAQELVSALQTAPYIVTLAAA